MLITVGDVLRKGTVEEDVHAEDGGHQQGKESEDGLRRRLRRNNFVDLPKKIRMKV